jgi:hypothetical protein
MILMKILILMPLLRQHWCHYWYYWLFHFIDFTFAISIDISFSDWCRHFHYMQTDTLSLSLFSPLFRYYFIALMMPLFSLTFSLFHYFGWY